MATINVTVSDHWQDVSTEFSLVQGSLYTISNGGRLNIFLREASSEPSDLEGITLEALNSWVFQQGTDKLYVRCNGGISPFYITLLETKSA